MCDQDCSLIISSIKKLNESIQNNNKFILLSTYESSPLLIRKNSIEEFNKLISEIDLKGSIIDIPLSNHFQNICQIMESIDSSNSKRILFLFTDKDYKLQDFNYDDFEEYFSINNLQIFTFGLSSIIQSELLFQISYFTGGKFHFITDLSLLNNIIFHIDEKYIKNIFGADARLTISFENEFYDIIDEKLYGGNNIWEYESKNCKEKVISINFLRTGMNYYFFLDLKLRKKSNVCQKGISKINIAKLKLIYNDVNTHEDFQITKFVKDFTINIIENPQKNYSFEKCEYEKLTFELIEILMNILYNYKEESFPGKFQEMLLSLQRNSSTLLYIDSRIKLLIHSIDEILENINSSKFKMNGIHKILQQLNGYLNQESFQLSDINKITQK